MTWTWEIGIAEEAETFAEPLYPLKDYCEGMAAEPQSADVG
jgi:hypothetical protein